MPVLSYLHRRTTLVRLVAVVALGAGLLSVGGPAPTAAASTVSPSVLAVGETLMPGEFLLTPDGRYRLDMQPDGNLVLDNTSCVPGQSTCALWSLGTYGQPGNRLTLQTDGNLVLYSQTGRAVWATMTNGTGSANVFRLQNDTNMVVYSGTRPVWYSGTIWNYAHVAGRPVGDLRSLTSRYVFATPGNGMAIWDNVTTDASRRILWSMSCLNDSRVICEIDRGGQLVLQTDGNLVWYMPGRNGGMVAVWNTNTSGAGPTANLIMQDDGNLVLYDLWHRPLWNSKGYPVVRLG